METCGSTTLRLGSFEHSTLCGTHILGISLKHGPQCTDLLSSKTDSHPLLHIIDCFACACQHLSAFLRQLTLHDASVCLMRSSMQEPHLFEVGHDPQHALCCDKRPTCKGGI